MSGRTESRQAAHYNDVLVAPFAWNAEVDPPIPNGLSYLYGEVPAGSIVFGGFVQVIEQVNADASFTIGDGVGVYSINSSVLPGYWPLTVSRFEDPTENFGIGIEEQECRMLVNVPGVPIVQGEFCLYLFYINDELGPFGQVLHPIGMAMMAIPSPQVFGIPPIPVADIPSPFPPAPLPELPLPPAWYGRRRLRDSIHVSSRSRGPSRRHPIIPSPEE